VVGSDVWIGAEAMIMPGVCIGHGAVIASRAVVTSDVPPYAVVAGMPARQLRVRFDEKSVAMLLEMAWWEWPQDMLSAAMPLLTSQNVDELYRFWKSYGNRTANVTA
jgi:chloramphenicol O-acetyltransferase type B